MVIQRRIVPARLGVPENQQSLHPQTNVTPSTLPTSNWVGGDSVQAAVRRSMFQNRDDEKHAWRTAADAVAPSLGAVQQMLSPWLNGRRVRDVQLLTGGLTNRNCRVRIDDAPGSVVLRLYDRDATACAKEVAVLELLRRTLPVPDVLYAEAATRDGGPPFAVLQFVEGLALRDLKLTRDLAAISQAAYDAGRLLARLQTHSFPRAGLLTPALTVDSSLIAGPITTTGLIALLAQSPAFGRRVEARILDRLLRVAEEWDKSPAAPVVGPTLVHGDFNSRNVLVSEREGKWGVAAILDWEFALRRSRLLRHRTLPSLRAFGTTPVRAILLARLSGRWNGSSRRLADGRTHGRSASAV